MTHRKVLKYWTEVHRVVGDEVKVTTCCCAAPGASRKGCSVVAGNKTPCRCFCHSLKTEQQARDARKAREAKATPSPAVREAPAPGRQGGPRPQTQNLPKGSVE